MLAATGLDDVENRTFLPLLELELRSLGHPTDSVRSNLTKPEADVHVCLDYTLHPAIRKCVKPAYTA
jgi:hypothetical protein